MQVMKQEGSKVSIEEVRFLRRNRFQVTYNLAMSEENANILNVNTYQVTVGYPEISLKLHHTEDLSVGNILKAYLDYNKELSLTITTFKADSSIAETFNYTLQNIKVDYDLYFVWASPSERSITITATI